MAVRPTHKCHECGEIFRTEDMVNYATPRSKTAYWYCNKCHQLKVARDNFSDKVCTIFGIKSPGPRIWKERQRLQETYGYTDNILIDCLDYIYNVEKTKKLSESLCLINPILVDKVMKYKKQQSLKNMKLAQAANIKTKEYVVPIEENVEINRKKVIYDPDDWLDI